MDDDDDFAELYGTAAEEPVSAAKPAAANGGYLSQQPLATPCNACRRVYVLDWYLLLSPSSSLCYVVYLTSTCCCHTSQ